MYGKLRISGILLTLVAASWTLSDVHAGGHRRARYCQPASAAPVTATSSAAASTENRQRYQSAYQAAAAPRQTYYAPAAGYRSGHSLWDQQINEARHIKGL